MKKKVIEWVMGILLWSTICSYSNPLVISSYSMDSRTTYYNNAMKMVAQRFETSTPLKIISVKVRLLPYNKMGNFRLRIFENEGSLPVPLIHHDIVDPILVKNDSNKSEITIVLPEPVSIDSYQYFIAFDNFSSNFKLLSDTRRVVPDCMDTSSGVYSSQCFMSKDSVWSYGYYSFWITLNCEIDKKVETTIFTDKTTDVLSNDTLFYNKSIASGDINNDGFNDLLVDGRLFKNDHGKFSEVTNYFHITGHPLANFFMDLNNDGWTDIIFINNIDENGISKAYLNNGDDSFTAFSLDIPQNYNPYSFILSDLNNDGFLDICMTPAEYSKSPNDKILILLNLKNKLGFELTFIHEDHDLRNSTCLAMDINYDSFQDLIILPQFGSIEYYLNQNVTFVQSKNDFKYNSQNTSIINNSLWFFNFNNDDEYHILSAKTFNSPKLDLTDEGLHSFLCNDQNHCDFDGINFENSISRIMSADFNNDGFNDLIFFSSDPCHFTKLYFSRQDNIFENKTLMSGFRDKVIGSDGIIFDFDEDGNEDIVSSDGNKLKLFKNNGLSALKSFKLSFKGQTKFHVGSQIELFSNNSRQIYFYQNGGGFLTQNPPEISIGIGENNKIDSIRIIDQSNQTDTLTLKDIHTNNKYFIKDYINKTASKDMKLSCDVYPNPFKNDFDFNIKVSNSCEITILIFDLSGNLLYEVARNEFVSTGVHRFSVSSNDFFEKSSSSGIYIYKIMTSSNEFIAGRLIKIN